LFLRDRKDVLAIEPLEKCQDWLARDQFFSMLSDCLNRNFGPIKVKLPKQIKLKPYEEFDSGSITYPVLVKANEATTTKMAHIMSLVFNSSGLRKAISMYEDEIIIQEFINHDMTVYKIYVIGDHLSYKPRKSCSNIGGNGSDLVTFNSAEPWAEELSEGSQIVKDLDEAVLEEIANTIKESLGLSIFGYDILVQSGTGDYFLVDVNVLPGFKEYSRIDNHIEALIAKKYIA
jgi:inositol-1,3,4-trisphosphate 5/6-kinase